MSGGHDQALLEAMRLPDPERIEASADRCRAIYLQYSAGTYGDLADRIIATTEHVHQHEVAVADERRALVAALAEIEEATKDASLALDELDRLGDPTLITPQRRGVGVRFRQIEHALDTIRLGVAAAKQSAPDPEDVEP